LFISNLINRHPIRLANVKKVSLNFQIARNPLRFAHRREIMNGIIYRDVTPADAAGLASVLVSANESAFRGRVPDVCLEFSEAESTANWQRFFADGGLPGGDFIIIAQDNMGRVAGYTWGGPYLSDANYRGEVRQLAVHPDFQRQGLGRRLVQMVAARLSRRDCYSLRVDVLEVNPNRAFYERLGAVYVTQGPYEWEGVTLVSYTYGWVDTAALIAGTSF
jgi:ribosomal protein S18 acetylase RimI-like enzyme